MQQWWKSFEVEHGPDVGEVANVHESGVQEVGDVVYETEIRIKSNTKICGKLGDEELVDRCIEGLWIFLPAVRKACDNVL